MVAVNNYEEVKYALRHLRLAGWRTGPVNGPVALCLHGWQDNANSFLALAPWLTDVQLVAIDLPGHGLSDWRHEHAYYHFVDWLNELVELIPQLSSEPIILIGHSMGGMIASVLAATCPELVAQLVLIDSLGVITQADERTVEQLREAILARQKTPLRRQLGYPDLHAAAQARLRDSDLDLPSALLLAQRGTVERAQRWYWHLDGRLRLPSAFRWNTTQARQLISAISAPVLAIIALDGLMMVKQAQTTFADAYPRLKLVELSGGHHLHLTHAQQVAQVINEFLLVHCEQLQPSSHAGVHINP
mgnify:CR=1 FL=1